MEFGYIEDPLEARGANLLAVAVTEGADVIEEMADVLDPALISAVRAVVASGDLKGKLYDEIVVYGQGEQPKRAVLLGVGKADELTPEKLRRFAGRAVRVAERLRMEELSISLKGFGSIGARIAAQSVAEGAGIAAWKFTELQAEDEDSPTSIVTALRLVGGVPVESSAGGMEGAVIARAVNLCRSLQDRPGNVATPSHLADEALRVGREVKLNVRIFDEARIREEGMHALLSVTRGSKEEARFIVMEYRGGTDGAAPLVLVGKGLTFDSGGISIKPSQGMEEMKYDMSGGAAVIATMQAIAELEVKENVMGLIPASDNMPSGTATKPGDVISSLAGKTIEVINTDAEGRLILADALAWGARLRPAAMVDCATLTGSVIIALGHHAAAVMGNDNALVSELRDAGDAAGERCWPLPLWDEYRKQLDSNYADLQNIGGRPAGSITAGAFLKEFVGDVPWAHLDIAGTAWGDGKLSYQRKGGTGFPTRLLIEWVRRRAG
ncbi:MAG TPA: leucyl aminopeptidase [Gemmatimonadetes bacterium]|nr:leucyl aminopeptidase [Gemmatimonadota bacterium]|tara:strand:- start:1741 stop:3228 length:1488 start_codon:yes stop_codon:yes gene_type:complete